MPTTSNFGWTTPADTDLVKDGAAAIRTLGNGIDTSLVDLKGGTTNQVLAKNSNTDLDFKWVADASGIPATIFDAKGDIIAATAADTADRLAVGTNGHVLTADSSTATGLKWAAPATGGGNYTLLNTGGTTLSGSNAVTISGISNADTVFVVYRDAGSATAATLISFRLNSNTNSVYDNYSYILWNPANTIDGTAFSGGGVNTNTSVDLAGTSNTGSAKANGFVRIDGCNAAGVKPFYYTGGGVAQGGNYNSLYSGGGIFNSSSTISSFTLRATNNFNSGIIYVYTTA